MRHPSTNFLIVQHPCSKLFASTGLTDPDIIIRPSEGQIDDLIAEIRERVAKNQRVLVTTLTKRMAEDLSTYLLELDIKTAYIHSEVGDTLERGDILRTYARVSMMYSLVLTWCEGLDLPEVSLVAIIDADWGEGFPMKHKCAYRLLKCCPSPRRKSTMYADRVTDSMRRALEETDRRRAI